MLIVILFVGAGGYMLLMAFGVVQKAWWERTDPFSRPTIKLAMGIFAVGLLGLSLYHWHTYRQYLQSIENPVRVVPPGSQSTLPRRPPAP